MKFLLLVCASLVAGIPVLHAGSKPASVYDYYDFVEISRIQPMASSRFDGPLRGPVASGSALLPRRITLPLSPRRPLPKRRNPFSDPRSQREPDYQLAGPDIFPPQYRSKPKSQQRPRPQYHQRPHRQPIREPEPQYYDYEEGPPSFQEKPLYPQDESVFVEQSQHQTETLGYQNERPETREVIEHYDHDSEVYQEEKRPQYQEDRRPQYQEDRRPQYQEDRRPQYQEDRRPQYQEDRPPQYQEDRRPQYQEERPPQYQEERRPQYEEDRQPQYQEERQPLYEEELIHPEYQEERPPQYYEEERLQYQEKEKEEEGPQQYREERLPSEKDHNPPSFNSYKTTPNKETEPVKEKREAMQKEGHLDENGIKFAADAAAIENAQGAGRLAFQIHGQQGPHSYRFGYDTGKGYNRQFRYEEKDGHGQVHGRYGFYGEDGKLQVVNYSAHPEHGFTADVPH